MSTTHKEDVSIKVDGEFLDEFERTFRKAQGEGRIPLDWSRSEAIRRCMHLFVEDPDVIDTSEEE